MTGINRLAYAVAGLLVLSGVLHVVVQLVDGGPWEGPVSWRKPVTFGLSFGITLATLTWVTSLFAASAARNWLLAVFGFACVLEVTVITTQAWRHVPSHFNLSTPLNAGFAFTAAFGGFLIIATSFGMSFLAFRGSYADRSMALAVRAGFVTFDATLLVGAAMIAIGTIAARTISQDAAYTAATSLKLGHFALMHGILALPVLAWILTRWEVAADQRLAIVRGAAGVYVLAASAVVVWGVAQL